MTFPKLLIATALLLFTLIGIAAWSKSGKKEESSPLLIEGTMSPIEVNLEPIPPSKKTPPVIAEAPKIQEKAKPIIDSKPLSSAHLPSANRIEELFNTKDPKLSIVETITYKSRVPWQKGRPAWLSDYAGHYNTSRHFIARSLNGKPDYFQQELAEGDRFNVFKEGKNLEFYLLIDTARSKMWFYALDLDQQERILLKTYAVGLGRIDPSKPSGLLTPLGKYSLGNKIAIYKPKMMGFHNGQKTEMIRTFGTRWVPFEKEISGCTAPAKGFGLHGVPWTSNDKGEIVEDIRSLGQYDSDGCIRLASADMEELFAIIITKPTTVEIVKDFADAKLPGKER